MHLRSALVYSFAVYILTFICGIIGLAFFGYGSDINSVPTELYLYGIMISIILMMIFTRAYFQKSGIMPNAIHGAYFGITAVSLGFLIDFCFAILPSLLADGGPSMMAYFSHPLFWANIAIIPVTSAITGSYLEKSTPKSVKKNTVKKTSKKSKKS